MNLNFRFGQIRRSQRADKFLARRDSDDIDDDGTDVTVIPLGCSRVRIISNYIKDDTSTRPTKCKEIIDKIFGEPKSEKPEGEIPSSLGSVPQDEKTKNKEKSRNSGEEMGNESDDEELRQIQIEVERYMKESEMEGTSRQENSQQFEAEQGQVLPIDILKNSVVEESQLCTGEKIAGILNNGRFEKLLAEPENTLRHGVPKKISRTERSSPTNKVQTIKKNIPIKNKPMPMQFKIKMLEKLMQNRNPNKPMPKRFKTLNISKSCSPKDLPTTSPADIVPQDKTSSPVVSSSSRKLTESSKKEKLNKSKKHIKRAQDQVPCSSTNISGKRKEIASSDCDVQELIPRKKVKGVTITEEEKEATKLITKFIKLKFKHISQPLREAHLSHCLKMLEAYAKRDKKNDATVDKLQHLMRLSFNLRKTIIHEEGVLVLDLIGSYRGLSFLSCIKDEFDSLYPERVNGGYFIDEVDELLFGYLRDAAGKFSTGSLDEIASKAYEMYANYSAMRQCSTALKRCVGVVLMVSQLSTEKFKNICYVKSRKIAYAVPCLKIDKKKELWLEDHPMKVYVEKQNSGCIIENIYEGILVIYYYCWIFNLDYELDEYRNIFAKFDEISGRNINSQ